MSYAATILLITGLSSQKMGSGQTKGSTYLLQLALQQELALTGKQNAEVMTQTAPLNPRVISTHKTIGRNGFVHLYPDPYIHSYWLKKNRDLDWQKRFTNDRVGMIVNNYVVYVYIISVPKIFWTGYQCGSIDSAKAMLLYRKRQKSNERS